jgi:hypothetical protein
MHQSAGSEPLDDQARRAAVLKQLSRQGWKWWSGVQFREPPCLLRTVKAEVDHSSALLNAKTYLEQAGFHPMGSARTKKRAKKDLNPQTLLFTRGARSHAQLFLVPSPKNMRIDVEISGVPVDDFMHTEMQIEYAVELPAGVGVAKASCNFWAQELIELEDAICHDRVNRILSSRYAARATAYCLMRNYLSLAWVILLGLIVPELMISSFIHMPSLLSLVPLSVMGGLLAVITLHVGLAMRIGR